MSFLKNIGKALGKAVKGVTGTVTKVANAVAPVADFIPGGGAALDILNKANGLVQGSTAVKGAQTVTTVLQGGKTVTTTPKQAVVAAQNGVGKPVSAKTAANIKTSNKLIKTGNEDVDAVIDGMAKGGLAAFFAKLMGTKEAVDAGSVVGWAFFKAWFKKNWYWVIGGAALLIGGIWYFVKGGKRKPKIRSFRR